MSFGDKLKNLRKKHNLTQEQLAEKLFVSRTAISKWESNRGYPCIDSLQAIAKIFYITVDELLSNQEILSLAKAETNANINKIRLIVFGLFDILLLSLIFIPLFKQADGSRFISVPLIVWKDSPYILRIIYISFISIIGLFGLSEMLFIRHWCVKKQIWISKLISIILHSLLILLLIINSQPYASALAFCFLLAKATTFMKPKTKNI